MIPIYVGYDPREALVYHTFCQSAIENASAPISFTPVHQAMLGGFDGQQDGTNAFIFSRYLVPYLNGFYGAAIFVDGDMMVNGDINELIELFDPDKAVQVVKHDYKTKSPRKYVGSPIENDNVDYDRKNWSSVMIFNCGHPANKILTPEFVAEAGGAFLHRFQWLNDDQIGDLPKEWNWLEYEYPENDQAKLVHHTLGSPAFEHYSKSPSSRTFNRYLLNALNMEGERQTEIVRRAHWHSRVTNGSNHRLRDTTDSDSGLSSSR